MPSHDEFAYTRFKLRTTSVDVYNNWKLNDAHHHLSVQQFDDLLARPFDTEWMTNNKINYSVLETFTAKHKLSTLILHGALQARDVFMIFDKDQKTGIAPRQAIMTAAVTKGKPYPNFALLTGGPSGTQYRHLTDCRGPSFILQTFNDMEPLSIIYPENKPWITIQIWRPATATTPRKCLGTLHEIRQIFAYYQMLMDGWVGEEGRRSRVLAVRRKGE
ncbi:MAG: hypothetical protein Q9218_001363 [Villophora microphyllina]